MAAFCEKEAAYYNDLSKFSQLIYGRKLIDQLDLTSAKHILDVGCGTGHLAAYVAESKARKGKVSALDPDTERIKLANNQYSNISNLSFYEGAVPQFLADKQDQYDIIYSNAVLQWILVADRLPTFQAMFKALKPGGIMAHQIIYQKQSEKAVAKILKRITSLLEEHEMKRLLEADRPFNMPELNEYIEKSGFELVCVEELIEKGRFPGVREYLGWLEGTFPGLVVVKDKYYKNQDNIDLYINEDGSVVEEVPIVKVILRKPER